MFIKRARPRPSARARDVEDDEPLPGSPLSQPSMTPEVGSPEGAGSVMERKKAQRKAKQLGSKGTTRLSFGGEEEGSDTGFKQKKSLLSQALKASTPVAAAQVSSSPSYSSEYLSELKAATPTRAPRVVDDEDEELSSAAREKYASRLEESSAIPDAAAVAAAKSKRKALLEKKRLGMDDEEDYIALGGSEPHPESRLMREEDEGEEGDEAMAEYTGVNDRLYLGKEASKAAARRMKGEIGEMIAEREEDESDEESREWERTLVARGGHIAPEKAKEKPKSTGYKPAPIPTIRPVPTVAAADARIAEHLERLRLTKSENELVLHNATRELVLLEEQERDIRKQVEEVESKREWAEGFQGWVETLGQFLEEKVPKLEILETDAAKYQRERDDKVKQRRAGDDNDDLALFLGVAPSVQKEDGAADSVNESAPNSEPRRTRRDARLDRRSRRQGLVNAPVEDGWSTDSELDPDLADEYEAAQHDLQRSVNSLLDDVKAEDFRDPEKGVAVHFATWRSRYPDDYNGAFGGLALVQAWEFWARSEMVCWDPLRSDTPLEAFKWFTGLYNYSRPPPTTQDDDDMDMEPELGEEGDLATEMVSKAVVPRLIKAFDGGGYDPYSAPQTRRAIDLLDVVAELTGKDSKKYQSLLKSVLGVFQAHIFELASAVAGAAGPAAIKAPPYNPAARSAMFRFVRRRLKLIRNLLLWKRTAPGEVQDLIARIISVVLRPVIARTWGGGGEDIAQKVLTVAGSAVPSNMVEFLRRGPQLR